MGLQILYVDPDESSRTETVSRLQAELSVPDLTVESAGTLAAAKQALSRETDAIITEYELPDGVGFELMEMANELCPDAGCILYTNTDPDTIDTSAVQGILTEYVGKDTLFGADRLTELVRTTIEDRRHATYPLPQTEKERIEALKAYNLDSDELRTALDRLTDIAATHFDVETASINIIDEHRQEYLACHGPATEWESTEREDSICTFTILEDDGTMIVEDVTEDPRFAARSEIFMDMGIRAYMGASLVTDAGLRLGSFCVYDDEQRTFTATEVEYLQKLSQTAMELIALHSRVDGAEAVTEGAS